MSCTFSPRLESAVAAGEPLLFLSPHLDDAILSCGGLICELSGQCPLTVATVFTEASAPPHTHAARSFLRQCSAADAVALYEARRAEDREVLARLGIHHVHLGATDALYRTRDVDNRVLAALGRVLPELVHRYPTYRFDIARGRVARGDGKLIAALTSQVADVATQTGATVVFCPIAVGRHVDHLVTRSVGELLHDGVVYYSDFPYDEHGEPEPEFIGRHQLLRWTWDQRIPDKHRLIRGYHSQVDALFPSGEITEKPETYFEAP